MLITKIFQVKHKLQRREKIKGLNSGLFVEMYFSPPYFYLFYSNFSERCEIVATQDVLHELTLITRKQLYVWPLSCMFSVICKLQYNLLLSKKNFNSHQLGLIHTTNRNTPFDENLYNYDGTKSTEKQNILSMLSVHIPKAKRKSFLMLTRDIVMVARVGFKNFDSKTKTGEYNILFRFEDGT